MLMIHRRVLLVCSQNGAVFIRNQNRLPDQTGLLPFHSTDTRAEAEGLQVYFCRLSRHDNETYFLNEFDGTLEDLDLVGARFEKEYQSRKEKR